MKAQTSKNRDIYIYFSLGKYSLLPRINQDYYYSFHWINRLYKQIYNRLNSVRARIHTHTYTRIPSITNSWTRNNFIYVVFPQQPRAIVAPAARGKEFSLSDYDRIVRRGGPAFQPRCQVPRPNGGKGEGRRREDPRCGDTAKNGWKNPPPIRSNDTAERHRLNIEAGGSPARFATVVLTQFFHAVSSGRC